MALQTDSNIVIEPNSEPVQDLLNDALRAHRMGRLDDAESIYKTLLEENSQDFHALRLLGTLAGQRGDPNEAARLSALSLAINPHQATALSNLGMALRELGHFDQALACFEKAIKLNPHHAGAMWNKAISSLMLGDFESGWRLYEWRFLAYGLKRRSFRQPLWEGTRSVSGSSILLYAEQGLGDTIQFSRYAELVAELGWQVILEVQPALQSTMSSLAGLATITTTDNSETDFEMHCPLASLPLIFRTQLHNVPARVPYLYA